VATDSQAQASGSHFGGGRSSQARDELNSDCSSIAIEEMKEAIVSGPVLKRPDWNWTFYVKTDWSSYAKSGALCQPECSLEAEEALRNDIEGKDGGFDKTISGFRL
jgi:RNase H-like domain found in reverse transcriptase